MGITLKNNAKTTLSSDITSTDTTIPVTDTSSFPALGTDDYFYCTIESTTGAYEIVKVTQVNNTNFLATRAQEDTIAIPFVEGARVELRVTVKSLEDFLLTGNNIDNEAYGSSWNGDTDDAPSRNAVYDKIATIDYDLSRAAYRDEENVWTDQQTFPGINIDGATPAQVAHIHWLYDGAERWLLARNTDSESGSNAGSNLELWAYNDAGGQNIKVFETARDTGVWDFLVQPTISGSNILKASDIGTSVQAYDADTAKLDVAQTWTANQSFNTAIRPTTNDLAALGTATLSWSDLFLANGAVINFNNGNVTLTHASESLTMLGGRLNLQQGSSSTNPTIVVTQDRDNASVLAAIFQGDRATPAAGDQVYMTFRLSDSAGNQDEMARMTVVADAVTSGAENGSMIFSTTNAGVLSQRVVVGITAFRPASNDGIALGSATISFSDLFLASGGVINWNNGDVTLTHATDSLTLAGGQLIVSQAAAASTTTARFINTTDSASVLALRIEGDRATPATNDAVYSDWVLSDSAGNQDIFGRWLCMGTTITSASEAALFRLSLITAGTLTATHEFTPTQIRPAVNDTVALGGAVLGYSDLFLASGAVINFNNGNATLTHSSGRIASSVPFGLPSYTVASLPGGSTGDMAYASNGRKNGEAPGAGTGVIVFRDASVWVAVDSGTTVAA